MLVFSRKLGQSTVIGGEITVTVLEVHGNRVKLGFSGPAEVPIHREELFRRVSEGMAQPAHAACC